MNDQYRIFPAHTCAHQIVSFGSDYHCVAMDLPVNCLPVTFDRERVLCLDIADTIWEGAPTCPKEHHVRRLFSWLDKIPPGSKISFNCMAGISRSTALALVSMVYRNPERTEEAIADHITNLYLIRPQASPNPLIITLADKILQMNNLLVNTVSVMTPKDIWDDTVWLLLQK